jgi:cobalt-zinc-cadmium efflux system outer membrane protein
MRYQPIDVSIDSLRSWAYQGRPDLRAALRRVDQARALKSLANAAVLPVPFLTLAWQMGTPFEPGAWSFGNNGVYALGFGFQVPLFDWNGGGRQRAEAGVQSAMVNDDRTRLQVESDIAMALDQFQASKSLVLRYQTGLLERARTALEQSRYAYQAGATSFVDLLDAIRTFGDTQSDYFHALHDYWVGAYALSGAVGKDLVQR